jgi:hypothetical protein
MYFGIVSLCKEALFEMGIDALGGKRAKIGL